MWQYDVKVKIISQKGDCYLGHKVGDEWIFGMKSPAGLCNPAWNAIYPYIRILQFGGEYEYPVDSGVTRVCCPDPYTPIIFELSKLEDRKTEFP